jgi:hypothetical protein
MKFRLSALNIVRHKNYYMKKVFSFALMLLLSISVFSQEKEKEEKEKGFKKENVFIGSGINLGFFNGFILGLNPEIGYSLNKFLDAGVSTNVNYITQNDGPTTYRQFTLGGGPFVRIWPVRMIFIGGQFEYNSIKYSVKNGGVISNRQKYSAPSFLVGGGYGSRNMGQSQFYTSIMVDVLRNPKSPYIDSYGRMSPVLRTTFTFYLKSKSQRR